MTPSEFRDWWKEHVARFTGLLAWLRKFPAVGTQYEPSQEDILNAWYRQLERLSLDDALWASRALACEAEEHQPRAADRHPAAIVALVRRRRRERPSHAPGPRIIDGQEVFQCLTCRDTGAVVVWHPRTVGMVRAGRADEMRSDPRRYPLYTCAVACSCRAAPAWEGRVYDPAKMLRVEDGVPLRDQLPDLVEWCEQWNRAEALF